MTAQHTEGPWKAADGPAHSTRPRDWYAVQHVFGHEPFEGVLEEEWGVYPPPGNAGPVAIACGGGNARLIATCPEMLEALEACRDLLETLPTLNGLYGLSVLEHVRAVIEKATGGASLSLPSSGDGRDAARWRRLVNASEMAFPVATIADDPENDCTMVYGRKRLEEFIDRLDEISDTYAAMSKGSKSHD